MSKPLGYIAYEGPSLIDGQPIVVIINRIKARSTNEKTGALVQSFILRADVDPVTALRKGDDVSICGDCPHRPILAKETGEPPCYVNVGRSVLSVWNAYRRGRYVRADRQTIARALAGKKLRIGTYGDPAAAPVAIWRAIVAFTVGRVGYSHQWKRDDFDHAAWAPLLMASADSLDDAALANLYGMRAFRVSIGQDRQAMETTCPASAEGGRRTTCADCMLCGGTSKLARDIVIADHASGHQARARRSIPIAVA